MSTVPSSAPPRPREHRAAAYGRFLQAVLAALALLAVLAPSATAASGDWTGTITDRQVVDQADNAIDESFTNVWTIGPTGDTYQFSLTGIRRQPTANCGVVVNTYDSAGPGSGSVNLYISDDPASPTGARLMVASATGAGVEMVSSNRNCVQYAPGLWRIETGDAARTPFFPYPINSHPSCGGVEIARGAQAVKGGITCQAGDMTGTWSVTAKRTTCDPTVDTDRGGVPDCTEFDLGTNPADPADDPGDCRDGVSNDFDGIADWPADPGCESASDPSEFSAAQCDNGKDDDGNGLTDMLDAAWCASPADPGESACGDLPRTAGLEAKWRPFTRTLDLSANAGGPLVRYAWRFGDGHSQTTPAAAITHTYPRAGEVSVRVRISIPSRPKCKALTGTIDIVVDPINHYAPTIRFDNDEEFFAGDPADFIRASSLMAATHRPAALGRCPSTYETVTARGDLEAGRLSGLTGAPYEVSVLTRGDCQTTTIRSDDLSVSKIEESDHGLYLNASNAAAIKRGNTRAPVYAEWVDPAGKSPYVVYWLWYPYNRWVGTSKLTTGPVNLIREIHEGDWEHVVLQVAQDNQRAKRVGFYQHYCPAEKVAYGALETDDASHFVVYSARGGHASYPNTTRSGRPQKPSCTKVTTVKRYGLDWTGGGKTWRPWSGQQIRDAQKAPWYGFGGAWGDQDPRSTGPLEGPTQNFGPPGPGPARSLTVDGKDGATVPKGWR